MAGRIADADRARDAARRESWAEAYEELRALDPARMEPRDLEALGDAAWWLSRPQESLAARQRAYAGYMAAGDGLRAAVCAGRLCMEHFFRSEASLAAGWLMRAQRLLRDQPEGVYHGYLALAESTLARARGAGYHLARLGRSFVILEADRRIGDVWRQRWDSLRLFTPARHDGLPGWTFPAKGWSFPSRDDMADYLEAYAARFGLPIRTGMPVDGVTGDRDGAVLVVGAGNSGAEIALESAGAQQVWLSGREVGAIPFRMGGLPSRLLLERLALRVLLHRVLTVRTPMGRKMRARMGAGERR